MKIAVVIPHYNHSEFIEPILMRLAELSLPIIVVDDGSDLSHLHIIRDLKTTLNSFILLEQKENKGKGAALCWGAKYAWQNGFTNIICVDADGQHDLNDIPKFLDQIKQEPRAVVLGAPIFDSSAPLTRRLGREISNILIWIETKSFKIRDALCGYRAYPLDSFIKVMDSLTSGCRMGFDVEILIRMFWLGIPFRRVYTKVCYPKGGRSHYRYFADNLNYIRLHLRYLFLSLLPKPLRCRVVLGGSEWDKINERGSVVAMRAMLFGYRILGPVLFAPVIHLVASYIFITGGVARRSALDFQRRLATYSRKSIGRGQIYLRAFMQFVSFGYAMIEKVESWASIPSTSQFKWHGKDEVRSYLTSGKGCVFVGAHFGNLESLRALAEEDHVKINALMFTKHAEKFQRLLREVNPESLLRIIQLSEISPALIMELNEKLAQGEVIALLADRLPANSKDRFRMINFLGSPAKFPEGPWILARFLDAPIYSIFRRRIGFSYFNANFERIDSPEDKELDRTKVIDKWSRLFVDRLEKEVLQSPSEWFNFYNFWG